MARRQWFDFPNTASPLSASLLNDLDQRKVEVPYTAINAKDAPYNAVGDGVADDTMALNDALTAALGKQLYIPTGTYVITAPLTGSTPNTRICGDGKGNTIIKYDGSGTALTWGTGSSTPNMRFVLEGVSIDGSAAGVAGLRLWGFQDFSLVNCDVIGFGAGYGIWLDNVNSGISLNTDVRQNSVGWRVGNDANLNNIFGGQATGNGHAIHVHSECECNTWNGVNISSSTQSYAVYLQDGQFNCIEHCYFENNLGGGGTSSIFIGDADVVQHAHFTRVLNNFFTEGNSVNYIIRVYRGQESLISGNLHGGTGSGGLVQIDAGGTDTVVRDNIHGTAGIINGQGVRTRASGVGFDDASTVASAANIDILAGAELVTVTGTTGITSITAAYMGRRVTLMFTGILTVTDGSNLKLSANFTTSADDTLTLISDGTNWVEVARSVN